jgi:hypothetical protein
MKHFYFKFLVLTSAILFILNSCGTETSNTTDNTMKKISSIKDVNPEKWKHLATKKIFFGHQSVGADIIDGINIIKTENNIDLNIIEGNSPSGTCLIHTKIGENRNPELKINSFDSIMRSGIADSLNIAFFKLCYIDINSKTNVDELFAKYKATMDSLKQNYPNITFVHITTPIRSVDSGIKGLIKKITGKKTGIEDNFARMKYNNLIIQEYKGKQPIFDLAGFESTLPNGQTYSKTYQNSPVYALANEYTYDGGHLNDKGKRYIATQFLIFLANL